MKTLKEEQTKYLHIQNKDVENVHQLIFFVRHAIKLFVIIYLHSAKNKNVLLMKLLQKSAKYLRKDFVIMVLV